MLIFLIAGSRWKRVEQEYEHEETDDESLSENTNALPVIKITDTDTGELIFFSFIVYNKA